MKILQVIYESSGSPYGFGGAGVRAYEIYKRLKDRHDITLLCMRYPGARDGEIGGLRHVFLGTESDSLTKSVLSYTIKAAYYVKSHGNDYDVIVENFLPATPTFAGFLTETPVILQVQGIMGYHSLNKYSLFYGLPMYLMERVYPLLYQKFVFVTDINVQRLMKRSKRHFVVPNGVGRELMQVNGSDGNYILFLSRIDIYTKGLDILVDAFAVVAGRFENMKLILAGYEFNSSSVLIDRLPVALRGRIEYAGFVDGEERVKLLSGATVFVLPSRHEAHPLSILEAMACGKPVVVSDIPELRFVEKNRLGLAFRSGSSEDLSEKISLLLEDEELRGEMGERGRRFAADFTWDEIAPKFEAALLEVAHGEG
ncbi:N, N'-diacetylbacillosaminyl-diphospho-undecaprenol alpha-1,3-N-acetylgalactosaminyltransferase [bacterium BMS3Bbin06]|nr:N, N'-diacetylbacillosaminyl-diphospho-undecaprenol alpha-1,3-N-acetylgalactosaminyltransferase [bacterium BMS3Bbin06]